MSADKLVDSTQLDADLTSVANAIRAKSGGSSQLAFPAGFVSEIGNIPSGGGSTLPLSGNLAIMPRGPVSGDVVLDFLNCNLALGRAFQGSSKAPGTGTTKLTVKCRTIGTVSHAPGVINYFCYQSNAFDVVEFVCSEQDYIETDIQIFQAAAVSTITGTPFALTRYMGTTYTGFKNATALVDVRFYENLSMQTILFDTLPSLSNDTLISIANALQVSEGTASLKLHATPKARLTSILGTVESVTRGAETYDRFIADANGMLTLADFITTTKGWTLA